MEISEAIATAAYVGESAEVNGVSTADLKDAYSKLQLLLQYKYNIDYNIDVGFNR